MSSGDLARAVRYTGGLAPVVDALRKIQERRDLQNYYNNLLGAWRKSFGGMNNLSTDTLPVQGTPVVNQNNPLSANVQNTVNPIAPANEERPINVQDRQPVQSNYNVLASPEKYREAQNIANNFLSEQLIGALKTPGVNTGAINALGSVLQNEASMYEPKPLLSEEVAAGGLRVYRDPITGQVVRTISNPKGYDKEIAYGMNDNNGNPITKVQDGKTYQALQTQYPPEAGMKPTITWKPVPNAPKTTINAGAETRSEKKQAAQTKYDAIMNSQWFTKAQLKSQGFNVDGMNYDGAYVSPDNKLFYTDQSLKNYALQESPEASNQWDKKGFEDQLKRITDKGYSRDEAISLIRGHEKDGDKIDQQGKNKAQDQVVAETDATANKLNSKYPGFERIYNALFQNPNIKNGKDIDKAIDEDMRGAPKDAIDQMKKLIHAIVENKIKPKIN